MLIILPNIALLTYLAFLKVLGLAYSPEEINFSKALQTKKKHVFLKIVRIKLLCRQITLPDDKTSLPDDSVLV